MRSRAAMSRRPRVQKSFSYSSEGDFPPDSPSESPIPGIGRTSGHRKSLRPFSNSGKQRRPSVFGSILSFLRKPGSSTPEPPDDQPDSGDVEGDQQVPPAEIDLLDTSLSQKHEEAWTQACFNAVAFVFVFITGCICLAVYYVLEPFLHPLMWAVLIGMVLHPFKYAGTSQIKEWLTYLDTTGIPLSLGLLFSPVFIFNWLTQYFEYCFMSSWKTIFGLFTLVVSLFLVYVLNLPLHAYKAAEDLMAMFEVLNDVMMERSYIQLGTLAIGFIILLVLTVRGSDYFTPMKLLSASLWFLLMFNFGALLIGSVALPLIIGVFLLAALIGKFCTSFKARKLFEDNDDSEESRMENGGEAPANDGSDDSGVSERGITLNALRSVLSLDYDETDSVGQDQETQQDTEFSTTSFLSDEDSTTCSPYSKKQESTRTSAKVKRSSMKRDKEKKSKKGEMEEDTLDEKPRVSFGPAETVGDLSPAKESDTLSLSTSEMELHEEEDDDVDGRGRPFVLSEMSAKERARARRQSNRVFIVLFTACFVVYVWRHPLLVLLFIPFGVWSGLKNAFNFAVARNSEFVAGLSSRWSDIRNIIQTRRSILLPSPIPTIIQIYLAIDKKISNIVRSSIGGLLTTFIIVSLLIGMTTVTILLLFEIQMEVMHYVTSALAVWNSTVADNQQINEWMGVEGNETTLTAIEKFANQNYAYGREWLTSQVRGLISDNSSTIEHHVVELYDQFYGYFVLNNSSAFATTPTDGIDVDGGEGLSHDQLREGSLPWAELKELASNNLEITVSVLKSVWAIISKNMTVALSFLYTLLGVLFSGGSALINFVVFITALFYLLSYSEEQYLPMKWVTDFLLQISPGASPSSPSSPSSSSLTNSAGTGTSGAGSHDHHEHGHAPIENAEIFSRIIRSVFHASFRRAFFYSLYTWLIHTMFGLSVSILPSVLAGIAGAMPFVGAYWVALPAVLELWLVEGQLLKALAVMGLSLLPLFFVDTIINREIEGGHPYLTGLAIAGGIYFAGLEGALIGPILLCCLLFFIDFYSGLFNNS